MSHLGHKIPTELAADGTGVITAPDGHATLVPADGTLVLTVTADSAETLARLQDVVGRHLVRFATAEDLTVTWSDQV